ncbi:Trimeric GatFAB AmidoTransferase(AdT) complex subunit [Cryptotrichosporon argae]
MRRTPCLAVQAVASTSRPSPYAWVNPAPRPSTSGKLAGRAVAIKENISYTEAPTTCSSLMLRDYSAPFNATCVDSLLAAGAHIVGATKMDEFGMGSQTSHLPHGYTPVHNPAGPPGPARSAGGSSGGSAAAVAEGSCWAALGTDTGGSVRLPASYCGVVGLKPSYGLISRSGVVAYADSLDCVGVLGRSVDVVEDVFDVLSHPDERDMTCAPLSRRTSATSRFESASTSSSTSSSSSSSTSTSSSSSIAGLRIGLPIQTHLDTPTSLPPALLEALADAGATLVPLDMASLALALPAYYVLAAAEAASNLGRFGGGWFGAPWERDTEEGAGADAGARVDGEETGPARRVSIRTRGFGDEVKKRILAGTYALTADAFNNSYLKALHLRRQLRYEFAIALGPGGVDLILHPTATQVAPVLDPGGRDNGSEPGAEYRQDLLTVPASLAGLPAMSVPAGTVDGWPVGVSVVGPWSGERGVFRLGRTIERVYR